MPVCDRIGSYPHAVSTLQSLRRRLPLVVFILILALGLVVLGVICACMGDHPAQAIERALLAIVSLPALVEVWALFAASFIIVPLVYVRPRPAHGRASPPVLQRFSF